ncbi:MAG: serine hydrolase domain-containing protein [Actinomycetota bacterium]
MAATRPWAITVLREGVPPATWPARGDHVLQVSPAAPMASADVEPVPTEAFLAEYDRSGTDAILVIDDGRVVYSRFTDGHGPDTAFNSFSMVKSLVGVLVLQALSDGRIAGLDATVGEVWTDVADTELAEASIGELLDMRSGLAFERPPGAADEDITKAGQIRDFSPWGPLARLHVQGPDAVAAEVRLIEADRGTFAYQQLNTAVLSRVLEEVHGRPLDEILRRELVEPAGAGEFRWRRHPDDGRITAYCCLYATAEWWGAVLAYLAANGGDDPLLSPEWFDYFLGRDHTDDERHVGQYRSQIRYDILDREGEELQGPFLYFSGLDGQLAYLMPDENLIVIRFGDGNQLLHSGLYLVSDVVGTG